MESNGVDITRAEDALCQNCRREPGRVLILSSGVTTYCCTQCVRANDGRSGWPYADDVALLGIRL